MRKEKLEVFLSKILSDELDKYEFYSEYTEHLLAQLKEKILKNKKVYEDEKEVEQ